MALDSPNPAPLLIKTLSDLPAALETLQKSDDWDKMGDFQLEEESLGGRDVIEAEIVAKFGGRSGVHVGWDAWNMLVIKLEESAVHGATVGRFNSLLMAALERELGEEAVVSMMSATVKVDSIGLKKDPDGSWNTTERYEKNEGAVVVLEAAVSESWTHVKKKADTYLKKKAVKMVIIINISIRTPTKSFAVDISSWTRQGNKIEQTKTFNSHLSYISNSPTQILTSLLFPLNPFQDKAYSPVSSATYVEIPLNKVELLMKTIRSGVEARFAN